MNSLASGWPIVEIFERCSRRPADEPAWEEFVRRFHLTIRTSVISAYKHKASDEAVCNPFLSDNTVDELTQAVYYRLVERRSQVLKKFDLDLPGSIYMYLAIVSYRIVFNHLRGVDRPSSQENT